MSGQWVIAGAGLAATVLMLTNRRMPAMFVLLLFGVACGIWQQPELAQQLAQVEAGFRWPAFAWGALTWSDVALGIVFLALPQLPMTVGNAFIAIRQENNRLFPDRPMSERKVAVTTGLMNVAGSAVGGVPMCHGAGGMAGHVAFGARTGGAVVILGALLLVLALFFGDSVQLFLKVLATPVLGVILFLTGAQLALGSCDFPKDKGERFVTLVTAAFTIWNVGLAFAVGLAAAWMARRGLLRL
jgi:MFS superfamily sulfate permease-like transporter